MSIAIASVVALVVLGVVAGFFVLPRIMGAAGGEEERAANETPQRSFLLFMGIGAAVVALLTNVAALAAAFYGNEQFPANAFPTAFIGITLGLLAFFLGARRLGIAAVVVTVVTLVAGSILVGDAQERVSVQSDQTVCAEEVRHRTVESCG
ncbi:MAG: hypothetical protein AVDCRST_MAG28-978 [uncultured Rubrobacteraceae bacterium]|uniref:Uncharacterized protein n=1 Tax=uncultured Rubrobacteraceae bacterium TaxID=349277 RepID=A0A6J4QKJ4_9ACTN|nr:MAG: hypothetical protein AVDCRST_MAG28-978 [uncultured Rubrobacteraceae bacterium]